MNIPQLNAKTGENIDGAWFYRSIVFSSLIAHICFAIIKTLYPRNTLLRILVIQSQHLLHAVIYVILMILMWTGGIDELL